MKRRKNECCTDGCDEPTYIGSLCRQHHEERVREQSCREAAVNALHTMVIDGRIPEDNELREELLRLRQWWDRACRAATSNIKDHLLRDEAEFALEWCIALAKEIVNAEMAFRQGEPSSSSLGATRHWVWERFRNLEAGLKSNGVARSV